MNIFYLAAKPLNTKFLYNLTRDSIYPFNLSNADLKYIISTST
jgi:hypothetical protein